MSLAWRSPRSIPTGQDGRRPLQHKLKVTYIYVLKCITHPLRTELPFSFRRLQPSPGLSRHPLGLHGHRTSSLLSRCPGIHLPGVREFCKSHDTSRRVTTASMRNTGRLDGKLMNRPSNGQLFPWRCLDPITGLMFSFVLA